jgi:hypothetical protein
MPHIDIVRGFGMDALYEDGELIRQSEVYCDTPSSGGLSLKLVLEDLGYSVTVHYANDNWLGGRRNTYPAFFENVVTD